MVLFQDFSGLLSPGRSMEHFEMIDEIKDYEIPVYRSQFLDTACILKVKGFFEHTVHAFCMCAYLQQIFLCYIL